MKIVLTMDEVLGALRELVTNDKYQSSVIPLRLQCKDVSVDWAEELDASGFPVLVGVEIAQCDE